MIQQVQRVKGLIRLTLSCAAAPPALHLWFVLQAVSAALDWIISPCAAKCKAWRQFFAKSAAHCAPVLLSPAQKPFHHGRIVVSKKQAFCFIQSLDAHHILLREREIKHLKVFLHPFFVGGFWNDDRAALQQKAQRHLCSRFTVSFSDSIEYRVTKIIVSPFGKGTPGHDLRVVLFQISPRGFLLLEHMHLHLIDRRPDLGKMGQIQIAVCKSWKRR